MNLTDFAKFHVFAHNFSQMHENNVGVNKNVVALLLAVLLLFTVCEMDHLDSNGERIREVARIELKFHILASQHCFEVENL